VDVVASADDAKLIGISVPGLAAKASKAILDSGIVARLRREPVEVRVTILASVLGTYVNMGARSIRGSLEVTQRALDGCSKFEPLLPILAEEDWVDIGPPETDYLNTAETRERLAEAIYELLLMVGEIAPMEQGVDGVMAILSHLDMSFRRGVTGMAEYWLTKVKPSTPIYIPATFVGNHESH
jgi:hypothetical protein